MRPCRRLIAVLLNEQCARLYERHPRFLESASPHRQITHVRQDLAQHPMVVLSCACERFRQQSRSFGQVASRKVEHREAVERQDQVFVARRKPLPVNRQRPAQVGLRRIEFPRDEQGAPRL